MVYFCFSCDAVLSSADVKKLNILVNIQNTYL